MNDIIDGKILKKYQIIKKIGKGAYGQVWKVINKKGSIKTYTVREKDQQSQYRALKKVCDCFRNIIDCQRTFRQITYLQLLEHPNIVKLLGFERATNDRDIYIQMQCMESDLSTVLKNGYLNELQKKYIFVQVVSALYYLHSAELIHRDIKPSNILIGANCEAKLCDFGLIRSVEKKYQNMELQMSENIATRWYKAPELLLGSCNYNKAVDIWGLGCVLGQIMIGKPIFQGTSTFNQLQKILEFIEKPYDIHSFVKSQTAIAIFDSINPSQHLSHSNKQGNIEPLKKLIPNLDPITLDLLKGLLRFDPNLRFTIEEVLKHPYFAEKNKYTEKIKFTVAQAPIRVDGDIHLNEIPISSSVGKGLEYSDKSMDKIASKNKAIINYFKGLLFDSQVLKTSQEPQTNGSEGSQKKLQLHYPKKLGPNKKKQELQPKDIDVKSKDKSAKSGMKSKDKISVSNKNALKKVGSKDKIQTVQSKKSISKPSFTKGNKSNDKSAKSIGEKSNTNDLSKSKKKNNLNQMIEKDGKQIKESEVLNKYRPSVKVQQKVVIKKEEKPIVIHKEPISRGIKNDKSAKKEMNDNSDLDKVSQKSKVSAIGPKISGHTPTKKENINLRSSQDRKFLGKYNTSPNPAPTPTPTSTQTNIKAITPKAQPISTTNKRIMVPEKKQVLQKLQQPKSQKILNYKNPPSEKIKSEQSNNSSSNLSSKNPSEYQNNSRFLYFPDQYLQKKKPSQLNNSEKNKSEDSRKSDHDIYGSIQFNKPRNFLSPVPKKNDSEHAIKIKVETGSSFNDSRKKIQSETKIKIEVKNKKQQEEYVKKIFKDIPAVKCIDSNKIEEGIGQDKNKQETKKGYDPHGKTSYRSSHNKNYCETIDNNKSPKVEESKVEMSKMSSENEYLTRSQESGKATILHKFEKMQKIVEEKIIQPKSKVQQPVASPRIQTSYKFKTIGMVSKYPTVKKH